MEYVSTRGAAPALGFDDVLLTGLARDRGLYVPRSWPAVSGEDWKGMAGLPYAELAARVMRPFIAGSAVESKFDALVSQAYAGFRHPAVVPLKQLDSSQWLMELFHGPTLAFKDVAMQLLGQLFDAVLEARGQRITIVGATSGDTGSAAIEACRDRERVDIFILHPKGRTSEVQRRQMTAVQADNVHNLAVEGTFDDCQDLVKALFADQDFRDEVSLSAVNSINWARVMAQIVYYAAAALAIGAPERAVRFTVPTGNFGNVFAGYGACQMGLPIEGFLVASNANDILTRFFASGAMSMEGVTPTLSPSMDIQISSNFERLLFDLYDREGGAVAQAMKTFRDSGRLDIGQARWRAALELFEGFRLDDAGTLAEIARVWRETGELIDPHTAVGTAAARAKAPKGAAPTITLATAHPAKFPDAVEQATGVRPDLPPFLADLYDREERYGVIPKDVELLKAEVRKSARIKGAAA